MTRPRRITGCNARTRRDQRPDIFFLAGAIGREFREVHRGRAADSNHSADFVIPAEFPGDTRLFDSRLMKIRDRPGADPDFLKGRQHFAQFPAARKMRTAYNENLVRKRFYPLQKLVTLSFTKQNPALVLKLKIFHS